MNLLETLEFLATKKLELSAWENTFVADITVKVKQGWDLTEKQENKLLQIHAKVDDDYLPSEEELEEKELEAVDRFMASVNDKR